MTPNNPVPVYPDDIPALLNLLIKREKLRLTGPTVMQAVADDKTLDREVGRAVEAAQAQLDAALAWVEGKA